MTERSDTSPNGGPTSVVAAAEAVLSLENAALPLAITRPDGRVAMANRAMRDLLGYGAADIVDRRIWELYAEEPEWGQRCFHKLLEAGQAWDRFLVFRRRDGQPVATYSSAVVTKDDRGAVGLVISHSLPI